MREAGFYSYDAAADDEDPVKRWIGREVKRFLVEAHIHLPFLLRLAEAPVELVPDSVQEFMNAAGEEEMQVDDDEFAPTEQEVNDEKAEAPTMMKHAEMWDNFLDWVRFMQEDWESDSDDYRKGRAVQWFNFSMQCSRDLLELKPTLQSIVGAAHSLFRRLTPDRVARQSSQACRRRLRIFWSARQKDNQAQHM